MKKRFSQLSVLCFCITVLISGASHAQTRYVTDSFEIMMRTGPSVKNKIVKALNSGIAVQVMRADAGNGYSQVKTNKGEIGYVLTRYLSNDKSAKDRVVYLEGVLEQLQSKPKEIQALLAKSQEKSQVLLEENTQLSLSLNKAEKELAAIKKVSRDAINLSNRNIRLEGEVQQLLLQLDDVRIQNEALKDNADYVRNLTMAGILLLGLFLGWILSRSGKQRRNSCGS